MLTPHFVCANRGLRPDGATCPPLSFPNCAARSSSTRPGANLQDTSPPGRLQTGCRPRQPREALRPLGEVMERSREEDGCRLPWVLLGTLSRPGRHRPQRRTLRAASPTPPTLYPLTQTDDIGGHGSQPPASGLPASASAPRCNERVLSPTVAGIQAVSAWRVPTAPTVANPACAG